MCIPVTLLEWNYVPQLEEWQLVLATPWYALRDRRTTYKALVDALKTAGISSKRCNKRPVSAAIGIIAGGRPITALTFASLNSLKQFLKEDLQVRPSSSEAAFEEIKRRGGRLNISRRADRPSSQEVGPGLAMQFSIAVQRCHLNWRSSADPTMRRGQRGSELLFFGINKRIEAFRGARVPL